MKLKTVILALLASATLFGCSSTDKVSLMADHRATILESNLPYKQGPLHIMSAKSTEHTVELLMIYNNTGEIAPSALVDASIAYYCSDSEVRAVIDKGVIYKLVLRNERGKLISEQEATKQVCESLDEAKK
ncbi:type II secretion system pilot lipoprotein GspS-beta [Vibrio algicola]|nr:type II secretion system pilot lipoprotein GspS-beta [Vibrio algicola]